MPMLTEKREVDVATGAICDCCHREVGANSPQQLYSYYQIVHDFGYGTGLDSTDVEAVLCDECLFRMIATYVHEARFSRDGKPVAIETAEKWLNPRTPEEQEWLDGPPIGRELI